MRAFVEYYDVFYKDKSRYSDVELFRYLVGYQNSKSVLELGSGTGEHSKILSESFESVYSVEIDSDMKSIAEKKLTAFQNIKFFSDFESVPNCTSACAFFYVVNYITSEKLLLNFLTRIRSKLSAENIFLFDGWNSDFKWDSGSLSTERTFWCSGFETKLKTTTNIADNKAEIIYDIKNSIVQQSERLPIVLWSPDQIGKISRDAGFRSSDFYARDDASRGLDVTDKFYWGVLRA